MVDSILSGSNNFVKRLVHESKKELFLKRFSTNDRFEREINYYNWLVDNGEKEILQIENFDEVSLSITYDAVTEQMAGEWDSNKVIKCLDFLNRLIQYEVEVNFPPAIGAFRRVSDHITDVDRRFDALYSTSNMPLDFSGLIRRLKSLHLLSKRRFLEFSSSNGVKLNRDIFRILSPSDFGGENILWVDDSPIFFDFEYSGFDCLSKLLCDFFYRPTGPRDFLSDSSVLDMVASFGSEGLVQIIAALKDISSIRWCLIILRQYEKNTITPGLIKNRLNQYIMRDCKWENMLIY